MCWLVPGKMKFSNCIRTPLLGYEDNDTNLHDCVSFFPFCVVFKQTSTNAKVSVQSNYFHRRKFNKQHNPGRFLHAFKLGELNLLAPYILAFPKVIFG